MNMQSPFLSQMLSLVAGLFLAVMTVAFVTIPLNLGTHVADVDHSGQHSQHMT